MRSGSIGAGAVVALVAAGCGTDAAAAAGPTFEIAVPSIPLAAGDERTVCFYTTLTTPPGTVIQRWESDVARFGHGLRVFGTPTALRPDGTVSESCVLQGEDLRELPRLLYTANRSVDLAELEPGVAMPIAVRQPVVVRLHLVNGSDEPGEVAARVRAVAIAPGEDYVAAAVFASYRSDLRIEPGATRRFEGSCELPPGVVVQRLSTLTMQHATRVEVSDASGVVLLTTDSAHPSELDWQSRREVTGRLGYACEYLNLTAEPITAGGVDGRDELCMVMAHVAPATADLTCIDDVPAS